MRHLFALTLMSILLFALASWNPARTSEDGIKFSTGSYNEVLKKARDEKKPIFIDIYATWCGPCKMLKRNTFKDKDVSAYFNEHFINASFDGEDGDGDMLAKKFAITGYPTLIFLDYNGNILKQATGYYPSDDFLALGKGVAETRK